MKFDCIVGNPPYQETNIEGDRKDQASNLWAKFWSICISNLIKENGIVTLITPTSWLSPSADLKGEYAVDNKKRLWDIFNSYSTYADVINVACHFPKVGSTFGYVIVDKSGNAGLSFSDNSNTNLGFLPKSNIDEVIHLLDLKLNLGYFFKVDQCNTPDIRVCVPMTRKVTYETIEILEGNVSPTGGSDKDDLYLYVHTSDLQVAEKVKSHIEKAIDILNIHCRWSGFLNIQILKMIKIENVKNKVDNIFE